MAKHRPKTNLYIVLVDGHMASVRYQGANRGSGRWCVCAKNEKDAEKALAGYIGKNHGSIKCYFQVEENTALYEKFKYMSNGQCETDS